VQLIRYSSFLHGGALRSIAEEKLLYAVCSGRDCGRLQPSSGLHRLLCLVSLEEDTRSTKRDRVAGGPRGILSHYV
jgi:hypothetical protein